MNHYVDQSHATLAMLAGRNSRKWSATEAVKQAENTLKHKVSDVKGSVQQTQFCGADQTRRRGEH